MNVTPANGHNLLAVLNIVPKMLVIQNEGIVVLWNFSIYFPVDMASTQKIWHLRYTSVWTPNLV